jgi:hypothetical protein
MLVRDRPAHRLTFECDDGRAGRACRVSVDVTAATPENCLAIILAMGWIQAADGRIACPACAGTARPSGAAYAARGRI